MGFTYTKTNWVNGTSPAINATNLINIEDALVKVAGSGAASGVEAQYVVTPDNVKLQPTTASTKLWTDANDGPASGLDADTLDTIQAISFVYLYNAGRTYAVNDVAYYNGNMYKCIQIALNQTPSTATTYWAYSMPALSGNVVTTNVGATNVATIQADVVANTMLANMAQNTIKGRVAAGAGDPEDLTPDNVKTILDSNAAVATTAATASTIAERDASADLTSRRFITALATGTSPLSVASTTVNTNLNADLLDGKHTGTTGSVVPLLDGANTWSNGVIQTFANTADATTSTAAGTVISGGLAVAAKIIAGTLIKGSTLESTVATTTAPLVVASTTKVANLNVTTSTHLDGATQWSIPYGLTTGTTGWVTGTSAGHILQYNGVSAPTWVAPNTVAVATATNLAGGVASNLHYQTGVGASSFIANGNSGDILKSNGATVPTWVAQSTLTAPAGSLTGTTLNAAVVTSSLTTVGTVTSGTWSGSFGAVTGANLTSLTAANISSGNLGSGVLPYITADTSATTFYPHFGAAGSGNQGIKSHTGLTYVPSTGVLSTASLTASATITASTNLRIPIALPGGLANGDIWIA